MWVWFLHSVVLVSWRFNFFYLESPVSGVQSLPSSFFLLVFPAYVLPRSPPSELRALLFKCLEQATFGSNFSANSIFQRVIGQLMELYCAFRPNVHFVRSNGTPHDFMTVSWTSRCQCLKSEVRFWEGRFPPNSPLSATQSFLAPSDKRFLWRSVAWRH